MQKSEQGQQRKRRRNTKGHFKGRVIGIYNYFEEEECWKRTNRK